MSEYGLQATSSEHQPSPLSNKAAKSRHAPPLPSELHEDSGRGREERAGEGLKSRQLAVVGDAQA